MESRSPRAPLEAWLADVEALLDELAEPNSKEAPPEQDAT